MGDPMMGGVGGHHHPLHQQPGMGFGASSGGGGGGGGGVGSSGRSRSLRRQMGSEQMRAPGPYGPGGSPASKAATSSSYLNSLSQPASARGSPLGLGRAGGGGIGGPLLSPTSGRPLQQQHHPHHLSHRVGGPGGRGHVGTAYGVSRSSNNSPLTLPMEHLPTSLSTSSAYGHGGGFPGGGTGASAYYDDLGSPGMAAMDGGLGPGGGGRGPMHRMGRRPPLRSYHSIEREPGYRDRSFDRMDSLNARAAAGGHLSRARDRSLDRALYASRDDPMHGSYGGPLRDRDGALLDDPALGVGGPYGGRGDPLVGGHVGRHMGPGPGLGPGGGGLVGDPRGGPYGGSGGIGGGGMGGRMGAVNDNFVMELQARLNDLQNQFSSVKRELDATTQKLGSSMHSIKTFWSPELKKERALRKEEAAKYALINDQLKILRSENQVQSNFVLFTLLELIVIPITPFSIETISPNSAARGGAAHH